MIGAAANAPGGALTGTIRSIAAFEFDKGLLVLFAGFYELWRRPSRLGVVVLVVNVVVVGVMVYAMVQRRRTGGVAGAT